MKVVQRMRGSIEQCKQAGGWVMFFCALVALLSILVHIIGVGRPVPKTLPSADSIKPAMPQGSSPSGHRATNAPGDPDGHGFSRKELIEANIADYREEVGNLRTNMYWQVGLALIGVLIVGRHSHDLELPFVGLKLPPTTLAFLLPLTLCYLWLEFGYKLNGLIEQRLSTCLLLIAQGDLPVAQLPGGSERFDAIYPLSQQQLMADSGFLDGWFLTYWRDYTIHRHAPVSVAFFGVYYATLFGFVHGSILATLITACQYLRTQTRWVGRLILVAIFLILVFSHWQFAWPSHNPNWLQACIWLMTIVSLYFLAKYGERRRRELKRQEGDCFKSPIVSSVAPGQTITVTVSGKSAAADG
jgi:hypothetical protein